MANLPETPQWEEGIYQIEVSDPVLGGPDGISNRQGKQLASRTLYLKQQVEKGGTDLAKHIAAADPHTQYAPKASPTFTGTPTAPTPANSDNSKKLATTEFVAKALAALAGSAPETLDTLKELADALGNDPNFATTVLNKLAEKLAKDQNGADIPDPALFVKNLGLGEGAKMPAATLSGSTSGYVIIPALIGSVNRVFVFQWTSVSVPPSTDGSLVIVDASGLCRFQQPACQSCKHLTMALIYSTTGTPFSSSRIVDRSKFQAASAYSKSTSTVTVWGVGY